MSMHKINWGILSTANIGRKVLIPAIQASNNGRVQAIASRDIHKAEAAAAQYSIPAAYGSYEELLTAPEIDAVYIPLPNSLHREWTIRAAEAGKHILCEKPLALTATECLEMENAARANGVRLMEAFMYRFHPQLNQVFELLQKGAIGTPRLIHACFSFKVNNPANIRLQAELGGGSLMDVGCYCVNLCRTIAGAEPVEVQAFAHWQNEVDEQMVGSLRFANGLYAQFDCALCLERRESYQIVGSKGLLDVPVAFLPGTTDTEIVEKHGAGSETTHIVAGIDEYRLMVEHFVECVLEQSPFRYPVAEAAGNMKVIEALYRSARNHGIPEFLD